LRQVLALAFHAHLWLLVLAPSRAFVRPRLRAAQSGRHLAIVDALLVARLAAEPLFGGSRRLGLDLLHLPACARSQRHLRYEYHRNRTGARTIVEDNISVSVQQQSGHCCRF
jgi:hypothetical protein